MARQRVALLGSEKFMIGCLVFKFQMTTLPEYEAAPIMCGTERFHRTHEMLLEEG